MVHLYIYDKWTKHEKNQKKHQTKNTQINSQKCLRCKFTSVSSARVQSKKPQWSLITNTWACRSWAVDSGYGVSLSSQPTTNARLYNS